MKFAKFSTAFLFSMLPLTGSAEEFKSKSDAKHHKFWSWLKSGESRIALGNFTSMGQTESHDRLIFGRVEGDKTVGYSSTFVEGNYITPNYEGFQFGIGAHAHVKAWSSAGYI